MLYFFSSFKTSYLFCFLFVLGALISLPVSAIEQDAFDKAKLSVGINLYQQGKHEAAILQWEKTARQYKASGKKLETSKVYGHIAEAYQALGQVRVSIDFLLKALKLAEQVDDSTWIVALNNRIGSVYVLNKSWKDAELYLNKSLSITRSLKKPELEANVFNNLGNLYFSKKEFQKSVAQYDKSLYLARKLNLQALLTRVLLNKSMALVKLKNYSESRISIFKAYDKSNLITASHDKTFLLIKIARLFTDLIPYQSKYKTQLIRSAYDAHNKAATMAESLNDWRAASYAYGYMGQIYEQQQRFQEALELTQRAIFYIQQAYAPEVEYQWEWQAGRIHLAEGDLDKAIESYARSVKHLQTIRVELTAGYENSEASFRHSVKPVFLQYTDLLLQKGQSYREGNKKGQEYFKKARLTVELFKAAELEDYFGDDCVAAARARVKQLEEVLSESTAIIYPIVLDDRLELLVSYQSGLVKYSVPVNAEELKQTVSDFRAKLEKRTTRQYLRPSRKLYDWLIRPIKADFDQRGIDTLVYVPDAIFRNIPFSALNDGKKYLVHHYALATTPGLDLTDPTPIKRENMNLLLNGLTESVQGFPALHNVSDEIEAIRSMYGGNTLKDQTFSFANLENEMSSNEYSVVHIASHGKFTGNVKNSFLLTYENKMNMDDLQGFIGKSKYRFDRPVELLTLSACESAAGDDMAALGLASVAIKSGARSALATLWSIDDAATSKLVVEFYRQLKDPELSKAKALQQAQLRILSDIRYRHAGYWAPFLLIGNWL